MLLSPPPTIKDSPSGHIKLESEQMTFEWVIDKSKVRILGNERSISSPIFSMVNNEIEFKLKIIPCLSNHFTNADEVVISLFLHSQKSKTKEFIVDLEVAVSQTGFKEHIICKLDEGKLKGFSLGNLLTTRSMLRQACDANGTVTIICKIEIQGEMIIELSNRKKCMEQVCDLQEGQLWQDFRLLFKESKFSDFTVIVETQKFSVHKVVLAARSPVFSAMFENKESKENLTNEVEIENMEPAVVEAMLEFFYTDEVTNLEELAFGLLEAADKYDVQRLRNMCEKMLFKILDKENAADILIHADIYRSYQLKEHVMEFIADHLGDVVESESYKGIKDPELLKELMCSVAVRQVSKK